MSSETKGQVNRKRIVTAIEQNLSQFLPCEYTKLANLIAYHYNLSPYTVRYTYLPMFLDAGIIAERNGLIFLTESGKKLQTIEGLTLEELKEEFQEDNEKRKELGKLPMEWEAWLESRDKKRRKPLL